MNKYLESSYRFGVIGGLFCVLAFVVFRWTNNDPTNFSMIFGYLMMPFFLFAGIKYFKDKNKGKLSFAHGMTIGFYIYSIVSIISGLGIYIILLAFPALFEEIKSSKIEVVEKNRQMIIDQLNEESFKITYSNILEMTPLDIGFNDFIWKILPGLFFTILISIILRKTKL